MRRHEFKKDLQDLLTKYEIDKYSGLHSYMMSEHIVRWIDEYVREQNVARNWSSEPQMSYYNYMKWNEDTDGIQSNARTHSGAPKGE